MVRVPASIDEFAHPVNGETLPPFIRLRAMQHAAKLVNRYLEEHDKG